LKGAAGKSLGSLAAILANTPIDRRDPNKPWLLSPLDLQAVKAAGVTFAVSMLERVIEEKARGNPAAAVAIREEIGKLIGDDLSKLKPGSPEAMHLKEVLIKQGAWSQYLEVGIGPDAEIFTKAPADVLGRHRLRRRALHPASTWNNPEPEIVLIVASMGASSARASATTSICAMSRAARPCCSARPRTTMRRRPSAPSSACSTQASRSIMSATPRSR
jgi:fumarylacetoacetate (FAA) hydrolase family protein